LSTLAAVTLGVFVFLLSALTTGAARRLALTRGIVDVPNVRSSHTAVTPRGGGVAIVFATTLGLGFLVLCGSLGPRLFLALSVGGLAVAAVGFLDDRHKLSARWRLAVHVLAAAWAITWLGGLGTVRVGEHFVQLGWAGSALSVLGVVWVINLFNFMDGIDGIATAEAIFVVIAGGLLALAAGCMGVAAAAWIVAWGCLGFLCWNWPPARIFLGDVGSGYLGYIVIVLALADAAVRPLAIWEWLILGSLFFVDSTVTLLRRLFRGDAVYQAHRQHAYQRLSRRWGSHLPVTLLVVAIDLCWLLPWAVVAAVHPSWALQATVAAVAPLLTGIWLLGAGQRHE
jgi:Fuc2NAc and GlcNAc transferase